MNNRLNFFKTKDVKSPQIGTAGSAGIDFFVPNDFHPIMLSPGEDVNINLGIITEFDSNNVLIAFNKSGVATKKHLQIGACVIDSDYRGEIHAHLTNIGNDIVSIEPGMKIVQFIFLPIVKPDMQELDEKPSEDTERGTGGFGSTGLK